jgi:hypothetical protein
MWDIWNKLGLSRKLSAVVFLATIALVFAATIWLRIPPSTPLFSGAGLLLGAAALVFTFGGKRSAGPTTDDEK